MGHSHSKVQTNIANNTVNKTDIQNTTKNIQETANNTLIKNANSCSSSVNLNNSCNISNAKSATSINIGGTQTNKATVNFSCIQAGSAATSMADAMTQSIANELNVLNGSKAANKINAAAEAAVKSGFASYGSGSSDASTNTNVSNNVTNSTKQIVENIFKKNLSNNFNSETVNECIGKTTMSNTIAGENLVAGESINVNCIQTNSVEQVQECTQLTEAINKTLSQTAQELGFTVKSASETSSATESTSKTKSEASSEGIASAINAFGNLLSNLNPFNSIFGMTGDAAVAFGIICCCIIISCCILSSILVMKSGGTSGTGDGITSGLSGLSSKMPSGLSKLKGKFKGGYSNTNSDIIDYLGMASIDLFSDIISDSPL